MVAPTVTKALPPTQLARLLAQHDPVGELLRRSPLREFTEALQRQDDLRRHLRQAEFEALTRSEQWPLVGAALHAARRANAVSETLRHAARLDAAVLRAARGALAATDVFARHRQLDGELKRAVLAANRAVLPDLSLARRMAEQTLAAVQPGRALAATAKKRQTVLSRMARLTTAWALEDHPALSVAGFVRLVRLRDVGAGHAPYEPAASDVYGDELGEPVPFDPDASAEDREADAMEAGTNPEVVAFPASAFPRVLDAAGFRIELPPLDAPVSDGGDASGGFDPRDRLLLDYVELRLRTFVETELRAMDGPAWMRRRIPKVLRDKWRDRRQQDRDRRGDCYPPIHYADLADLLDVICQKHNWADAFRGVFEHEEELRVGMRRLVPIRNALAHARPLVRTDRLFLGCEAYRLLRALGGAR